MKDGDIRNKRLEEAFCRFIVNVLTESKFCEAISSKKYMNFISAITKFHSNVIIIGKYLFKCMNSFTKIMFKKY